MIDKQRNRLQDSEGGGVQARIMAIIFGVVVLLGVGVTTNVQFQKIGTIKGTLTEGAKRVSDSIRVNGCVTQADQTNIANYLKLNGLDLDKVYFDASTSRQGYGSTAGNGAIGYNFSLKIPFLDMHYNLYLEEEVPNVNSNYVAGMSSDKSVCVGAFTEFSGVQSPDTDFGETPIVNVTNPAFPTSVTLTGPDNIIVGQSEEYSGMVNMGSSTAPGGTQVEVSSPDGTMAMTTQADGSYRTTLSFSNVGPQLLTAKAGIGTASQIVTVSAGEPADITLINASQEGGANYQTMIGKPITIKGKVKDAGGNPILSGDVSITSDISEVPNQTLKTNYQGAFNLSYTPKSLGMQHITFTIGEATTTASVDVLQGTPQTITLESGVGSTYSSDQLTVTAGQAINLRGTVSGLYDSPVLGAEIVIDSPTDSVDDFSPNGLVATNESGSYSNANVVLTQTGTQKIQAATEGIKTPAQIHVTVNPGPANQVVNLAATPTQIGAGGTVTITGQVLDEYGNPVQPGTMITLVGPDVATNVTTEFGGQFAAAQKILTPGMVTLNVQSAGVPLRGGTVGVKVLPTGAYSLTVDTSESKVIAGEYLTAIVTLKDNTGATIAGKSITLSETPEPSALMETQVTTDSNGQAFVTVGPVTKVGYESVMASMDGVSNVIGTATFEVLPSAPSLAVANVSPSTTQVWTVANPVSLPIVSGTVTDIYGNPIPGAEVIISGGYGVSASGVTDINGYFAVAIKPTNIGGPYPITISSDTWSDTIGTLTVVPKPPTLIVASLRGSAIADVNVPYSIRATLTDSDGTPIKGVAVKLDIPTDGDADYSKSISTDNSGNALFTVEFTKVSNQRLEFSCTVNGKSLKSMLYLYSAIPVPGNVVYQSVTFTTVKAESTLTVSGVVYSQFGNPMPLNTEVRLSLPGSNAPALITHTASDGSFTATLKPTKTGSFTLGSTVNNATFNYGTNIKVTAGEPTTGTLTYSDATVQCGNYNTAYVHLFDHWGNNVPDATVTLGTNASVTVSQMNTDENGMASVSVGPFNTLGTYHFYTTSPLALSSVNFTVYDKKFVTILGPNYTSSGAVPSSYSYNSNGYSGTLNRNSIESVVVSGTYTPEGSITEHRLYHVNCSRINSSNAEWAYLVDPGEIGVVFFRIPHDEEIPDTFYYHHEGFHGTLHHDTSSNSKDGYYTGSGYVYTPDGEEIHVYGFYLTYTGTVFNDAVDTRVYNYYGSYSGYVTKWP